MTTPPRARRPLPADATGPGLAYHRLVFARQRTGWWTPLLTGLLGLGIYVAVSVVLGILLFLSGFLLAPETMAPLLTLDGDLLDVTNPFVLAVSLGSIALMWPAFVVASRVVNGTRIGLLSSVAGRLRLAWLGKTFALAVAVVVVVAVAGMALPAGDAAPAGSVVAPADNPHFLAALLVVLLIVPFQAAAEEYVFRGYLGQAVGRWLRHPAWAILLPVPLFVFGHLYDAVGLTSVAVFAIAAGWLTWRTGGLEAAISLHIVNNLFAFVHALLGFSDPNASETDVWSLVSSVVMIGAYVAAVEVLFRRGDRRRTLRLVPVAPPVWTPPVSAPPADPGQAASASPSRIV